MATIEDRLSTIEARLDHLETALASHRANLVVEEWQSDEQMLGEIADFVNNAFIGLPAHMRDKDALAQHLVNYRHQKRTEHETAAGYVQAIQGELSRLRNKVEVGTLVREEKGEVIVDTS